MRTSLLLVRCRLDWQLSIYSEETVPPTLSSDRKQLVEHCNAHQCQIWLLPLGTPF